MRTCFPSSRTLSPLTTLRAPSATPWSATTARSACGCQFFSGLVVTIARSARRARVLKVCRYKCRNQDIEGWGGATARSVRCARVVMIFRSQPPGQHATMPDNQVWGVRPPNWHAVPYVLGLVSQPGHHVALAQEVWEITRWVAHRNTRSYKSPFFVA